MITVFFVRRRRDANSVLRFLFKWWLIGSTVFWGIVGILSYLTYRDIHQ
jgi:hypothetical protein